MTKASDLLINELTDKNYLIYIYFIIISNEKNRDMKKFKIFMLLILLTTLFSLDLTAQSWNHHKRPHPVSAPLDGGLLTILGAAGVAYFVARKKKKDS